MSAIKADNSGLLSNIVGAVGFGKLAQCPHNPVDETHTALRDQGTIYNSIFWQSQAQNGTGPLAQIYDDAPSALSSITYSLVEGGCPPAGDTSVAGPTSTCANLLSADPLFVRAPDPGDGDWTTFADNDYGDLRLQPGSPAIDAGDTAAVPGDTLDLDGDHNFAEPLAFDLVGNPRIQHSAVDMGA